MNPLGVSKPHVVLSGSVLVEYQLQPFSGHGQDLPSQTRIRVEFTVGLPPVDNLRFDVQLISGNPLDTKSIEKPRVFEDTHKTADKFNCQSYSS